MAFATHLLGAFVGCRTGTFLFFQVIVLASRQTEIGYEDLLGFSLDENVCRFDISMNDFLAIGNVQRFGNLLNDRRDLSVIELVFLDLIDQCPAIDESRDDKNVTVAVLSGIIYRHNVRMRKLSLELGFLKLLIRGEAGSRFEAVLYHFDRNDAVHGIIEREKHISERAAT